MKIRVAFKIVKLYLKRKRTYLLVILGAALFLLILALNFLPRLFKPTVTEAVIGTYTGSDIPEVVGNLISKSLVSVDRLGNPYPNLVSGWQTSGDAKEFIFTLKKDLFYTDGQKVTASSLDIKIPDVEVQTPDEQTLKFVLKDSFSPFPTLLRKPVFKKNSKKNVVSLVGVGPYTVSEIQKDGIFIKKLSLSAKGDLPDIAVKFYPSESVAKTAYKLGEVQSIWGISETQMTLDKTSSIASKINYQSLVTIFYNIKDPVLSDENLRLALSYAAPKIEGELTAKTSISPLSWAFNKEVRDFLDREDQARISLSKVQKKDTIVLTTVPHLKSAGEKVVEGWNRLGMKAVLRVESGIPQNFQALLIAQSIPPDPDQYSLWHSTQTQTNISKFSQPRVDKDLEDARKTTSTEERLKKYQDFQKVLLDHSPATFLYFSKYNILIRKKIAPYLESLTGLQLSHI